jgi:predicted nucleic acid-binding protein
MEVLRSSPIRDNPGAAGLALVVVAAVRSGADTLYTEDLNDGQILCGVRIVNPFSAPKKMT